MESDHKHFDELPIVSWIPRVKPGDPPSCYVHGQTNRHGHATD